MAQWAPRFAITILFLALASGGWDNRLTASLLAIALGLIFLAALAAPLTRRLLSMSPSPWAIAACYGCVLAVGVLQLWPGSVATAHPAFEGVRSASLAIASIDPHATRVELAKLMALACSFGLGVTAGRSGATVFLRFFCLCGAVYAIWSTLQFSFGVALGGDANRLFAGLGSANVAAAVFIMVTLVAAGLLVRRWGSKRWVGTPLGVRAASLLKSEGAACSALVVGAIAIVLTASRGGVFIAAISAAFIGIIFTGSGSGGRSRAWPWRTFGGAMLIAVFTLALFGGSLFERFGSSGLLQDARLTMFKAHLPAVADRLVWGHGFGSFAAVNDAYMTPSTAAVLDHIGSLHNAYLQWLEEGGLVASVAMWLTVLLIARPIVVRGIQQGRLSAQMQASLVMFGAVAVHSSFDYVVNVFAVAAMVAMLLGLFWSRSAIED